MLVEQPNEKNVKKRQMEGMDVSEAPQSVPTRIQSLYKRNFESEADCKQSFPLQDVKLQDDLCYAIMDLDNTAVKLENSIGARISGLKAIIAALQMKIESGELSDSSASTKVTALQQQVDDLKKVLENATRKMRNSGEGLKRLEKEFESMTPEETRIITSQQENLAARTRMYEQVETTLRELNKAITERIESRVREIGQEEVNATNALIALQKQSSVNRNQLTNIATINALVEKIAQSVMSNLRERVDLPPQFYQELAATVMVIERLITLVGTREFNMNDALWQNLKFLAGALPVLFSPVGPQRWANLVTEGLNGADETTDNFVKVFLLSTFVRLAKAMFGTTPDFMRNYNEERETKQEIQRLLTGGEKALVVRQQQ